MSVDPLTSPPSGRHGLGPHVVGQRCVIRRLARGADGLVEIGPSGGPAMTDVLGVVFAWDAMGLGKVLVQPDGGTPVSIAISDIVSGKPVPPRPPVRHRLSVDLAESLTAKLWPSVETRELDEWTLRLDPDGTRGGGRLKRANSCLAVLVPERPVDELLDEVVDFYLAHDRPPLVHVEVGGDVEAAALEAGWVPLDRGDAEYRLGSVAQALRVMGRLPKKGIALNALGDRARTSVKVEGVEVAAAEAHLSRDHLGLHNIHVDEAHRRQYYATRMMRLLLDWGASEGARSAWLHVETINEPAKALYERLGLTVHHTMRYLRPAG